MVIKRVSDPERGYYTSQAKEVKVRNIAYALKKTRKCYELNNAKTSKITVNKKLTRKQARPYEEAIKRDKDRHEANIKKMKKQKMIVQVM